MAPIKQIAVLPNLPEGWAYYKIRQHRDFIHGTDHWFVRLYMPAKAIVGRHITGDQLDLAEAINEAIGKIGSL